MKNLALAVLIALLISYSFGFAASELFDFSIHLDDHVLSKVESVAGITIIGIVMAVVGVLVAVSIFGAMFLAIIAAIVGILFAGLSLFWPMILVIAVIIWLVKDKRQAHY